VRELLKKIKWQRVAILIVVLLLMTGICLMGWLQIKDQITDLESFRTTIRSYGVWSYLIMILLVALQVIVAVIPAGPFQLAAGFAFGNVVGIILNLCGCALGSGIMFLLVRKFGMKFITFFVDESEVEKIKVITKKEKWKWVLMVVFLIPGTPKDVIGIFAGLTDIKLWEWLLIATLGRLPAIVLTVMGGAALFSTDFKVAAILIGSTIVLMAIGAIIYKVWNNKQKTNN